MGYGDEIIGSGLARGAAARGKRIAFGDGNQIKWSNWAEEIYRYNPNVAPPGSEHLPNLEWIRHYKGHRLYGHFVGGTLIFNPAFSGTPGEFFFNIVERDWCPIKPGFVLVEPFTKDAAPNKQWPIERYAELIERLQARGYRVAQFIYDGVRPLNLKVESIHTPNFRRAVSALDRAQLFIGSEGGLHHAAAAVGIPAVVLFGGFIHPRTTGYAGHTNIFVGNEPCGQIRRCHHCIDAMNQITVDQVLSAALGKLERPQDEIREGIRATGF